MNDDDISFINITEKDLAAGKALAALLGVLTDAPEDAAKALAYAAISLCDGMDTIMTPDGPSIAERAEMKQTIVSVVLAIVAQSKHGEGNAMAEAIRVSVEQPTDKLH